VSRRADPRQQAFWPQPSLSPGNAAKSSASVRLPPPPPSPLSPPDVTSAGPPLAIGTPCDPAEALIDVERTCQVFRRLLPLLRELRRRAAATSTPEHNRRILNGQLQTSKQDATNEQSEEFTKPVHRTARTAQRDRAGQRVGQPTDAVSPPLARTAPRSPRHSPADQRKER
jgi:hypothetical protein